MVFIDFLWFGASKNRFQIDANMHYKKTAEKTLKKSILVSILASPNLLKPFRNPHKTPCKATQDEARSATLWKAPGPRRKLTETVVCKASKWLRI